MPKCYACGTLKSKESFSITQLNKKVRRKCGTCVSLTPGGQAASSRFEGFSKLCEDNVAVQLFSPTASPPTVENVVLSKELSAFKQQPQRSVLSPTTRLQLGRYTSFASPPLQKSYLTPRPPPIMSHVPTLAYLSMWQL